VLILCCADSPILESSICNCRILYRLYSYLNYEWTQLNFLLSQLQKLWNYTILDFPCLELLSVNTYRPVGFQVFTVVSVKNTVFWIVMLYILVKLADVLEAHWWTYSKYMTLQFRRSYSTCRPGLPGCLKWTDKSFISVYCCSLNVNNDLMQTWELRLLFVLECELAYKVFKGFLFSKQAARRCPCEVVSHVWFETNTNRSKWMIYIYLLEFKFPWGS
jgi:hypothetical protein